MSNFNLIYKNINFLYIKKIFKTILLILLFFIFANKHTNADESGTIKIATHYWTSQKVGAIVIGELMKMGGEKIEYVSTDSQTVYQSMADGDIDIVHEIWEGAFGFSYEKALGTGNVEEVSTHEATAREGWWYPDYVEDICPGMPDWKALSKCSKKFARPDSNGKGVFIGGLEEWLNYDYERIQALEMNFIIKKPNSANEIWTELDLAVSKKEPIVIYNWSPNFVGAKYKGKFVKFPEHEPKCHQDPSWGVNPKALYDCDNPANGYIKLAVNKNFKKNHPNGYKIIKKINFSGPEIEKMANYVVTDKLEISAAAQKWLDNHEHKWKEWVN